VINNNGIARPRHQSDDLQGHFASRLLYQINDDWNVLLSQSYQNDELGRRVLPAAAVLGRRAAQSARGDAVQQRYDNDRFESTAWTVNGKFGALNAVYTGGYLVRKVDQIGDYTNYARGVYADYYQCFGPGSGGDLTLTSTCKSPERVPGARSSAMST
jgi:iron complex outermembrane receptor protein